MADSSELWGSLDLESLYASTHTKNTYNNTTTRGTGSTLDKDAFLSLLVTQLKYQDPLNPVEDKEFLSQMAQFTSLEQMQNMNQTMTQSQSFSMIGKFVQALVYDEYTNTYSQVEGVVSAVTMQNGKAMLKVDGKDVPVDSLTAVTDLYNTANDVNNINNSLVATQNMNLMGKFIQALTLDENYNVTGYVEGRVDYVKVNGNNVVLVVGDKEVFANEIVSVSDDMMLLGKPISASVSDGSGGYKEIHGYVENVVIRNDNAYLVIDGTEVYVNKINYPSEALRYVTNKTQISYDGTTGIPDSVIIKNGKPYLRVNGTDISYLDYKGIK